jgi:hypothetical protein
MRRSRYRRSTARFIALALVSIGISASPAASNEAGPQAREFTQFTNAQLGGSCSHPLLCSHREYSESTAAYSEMSVDVWLEAGAVATGFDVSPSPRVVGTAFGSMDAVYHLTAPVTSLTIQIEARSHSDAWAELRDEGEATAVFRATATHPACAGCGVSHHVVLADDEEQLAPVEECLGDLLACAEGLFTVCACSETPEDIMVTLEMTGPEGRVPAGDITIRSLIEAVADHLPGVPARASVFATLERVTVTPHTIETV